MLCMDTPNVKAIPAQVSPAWTVYDIGVGVGSGVSVGTGVSGVGVTVGVTVEVNVGVMVGSTTRPVSCSAKNTRTAPIPRKSASKIRVIGRLNVIWGIRLP